MNAKQLRTLQATAHHEAGHAIAAYLHQLPFRYVTIVPDENRGSLGHLMHHKAPEGFNPEFDNSDRTRRRIERMVITSFAGGLAEAKFLGRHNHRACRGDYENAFDWISHLCGSTDEEQAYIGWLTERAKNTVSQPLNWFAIQKLAAALIDQKRIGSKAVRTIIQAAMREAMSVDSASNESAKPPLPRPAHRLTLAI